MCTRATVQLNPFLLKIVATGITVDASQEMITLGLCNIIGSCCKSMPTCGAFTRSAVSHASGVKTPMAGLYSSIMTVLALSLLTPYFYYIPKATLASVLVIAVIYMVRRSVRILQLRLNISIHKMKPFLIILLCHLNECR